VHVWGDLRQGPEERRPSARRAGSRLEVVWPASHRQRRRRTSFGLPRFREARFRVRFLSPPSRCVTPTCRCRSRSRAGAPSSRVTRTTQACRSPRWTIVHKPDRGADRSRILLERQELHGHQRQPSGRAARAGWFHSLGWAGRTSRTKKALFPRRSTTRGPGESRLVPRRLVGPADDGLEGYRQRRVLQRPPITEGGASPGATLFVPFTAAPGATKTIVLRLAWYVGQTTLRVGKDPEPKPARRFCPVRIAPGTPDALPTSTNDHVLARPLRPVAAELAAVQRLFSTIPRCRPKCWKPSRRT